MLLGGRPRPFVGGISDPLYRWHWPLIVYTRMLGAHELATDIIPVVLAVVLTWGTKELVEGPARFGTFFGRAVWGPGIAVV